MSRWGEGGSVSRWSDRRFGATTKATKSRLESRWGPMQLSSLQDVGGAEEDDMAWVRPSDWVAMPATAANQIDILAAVTNDASNYVALSATVVGGFTVDWGDGDVTTHASAAVAEHTYDYADADLGALTTRGYKQALIKITATVAATAITVVNLSSKNTRTSLNAYANPWLDIQINAPSATTLTLRATNVPCPMVERINIVAIGAITTFSASGCYNLQSMTFPSGSLQSVTSILFTNCGSLQTLEFPVGSLAALNTLANAFQGSGIRDIVFPAGSLGSVTTLDSAFLSCFARTISFPTGALSASTTLANAFNAALSLREITLPYLPLVTVLSGAWQGCLSLQKLVFLGGLTSVTTIANMVSGCPQLHLITFPSGWGALVVTTTTAFATCPSLAKIDNCSIPVSFSVASAKLAGVELDAIYTALPVVVATITVTTNHGTPDDTPTIATGKGWTVTGS